MSKPISSSNENINLTMDSPCKHDALLTQEFQCGSPTPSPQSLSCLPPINSVIPSHPPTDDMSKQHSTVCLIPPTLPPLSIQQLEPSAPTVPPLI